MNLVALLLPALLPAFADGFKGLFSRLFGNSKPLNVQDQIALKQADAQMMQAIATMDTPGVGQMPSQWVIDLRASFRYLAAGVIILTTVSCILFVPDVNVTFLNSMLQLTGSVFSFMFGDRVYLSLKNKG